MGDSGFFDDLIKHSQQLERELNEAEIYKTCAKASLGQLRKELVESKGWVKAATESVAIASATIARLESERDQLRKVCDDLYKLDSANDREFEDATNNAYNSLPHVIAKGKRNE